MHAGATSERGDAGGSDEEEAADESGQGGVRRTEMRGGTGLWTDQASSGISSILATRPEKSSRRVGTAVHDTQYPEGLRCPASVSQGLSDDFHSKLPSGRLAGANRRVVRQTQPSERKFVLRGTVFPSAPAG